MTALLAIPYALLQCLLLAIVATSATARRFWCPKCERYCDESGVMSNYPADEERVCECCEKLRGQSAVSSLSSGLSGASRTRATDSANPAPAESRVHHVSEKSDQAAGGVNLGGMK